MEEQKCVYYKCPNHTVNLNDMRLTGKLCDVTIKVGDREIRAHKVILAANLKYFESMFLNSFQESKKDVVIMKDIEATNLEHFICFAYTGEIVLTDSNALSLLEVANYLSEDGIKEACIDFLKVHLKKENACQAYKFANSIDCFSLKDVARQIILLNFEDCSQTEEYLDLNCESLKDIFSESNQEFLTRSLKMYFESVIKWVMHDVKNRSDYITDLLDLFELTKLPTKYLLEYLCECGENQNYDDVTKAVMSSYYKKIQHTKLRAESLTQSLVIIGVVDNLSHLKLYFQSYNFIERKWSQPRNITYPKVDMAGNVWNGCAIVNNHLYFTVRHKLLGGKFKMYFQDFNPATMGSIINFFADMLLSTAAVCACTRFIYLCGGAREDKSLSNQVVKYDPETDRLHILPSMVKARHNAVAIFYQGCLHVLGGFDGLSILKSVERYDPDTKKWTTFPPMCEARRLFGAAVLNDKLYVCGGEDTNSCEVYEPSTRSWRKVANMKQERAALFVVAHQGKLLAVGGNSNKAIEVYDPVKDQWQIDYEMSSGLEIIYGTGGLILSDCIADVNYG